MFRRLRVLFFLLAVIAATTAAHSRIPHRSVTQLGDEFIPRPAVAKITSLGFDALHSDYYWVQAVLLAGGSKNPAAESVRLGRLIDVVTTLDPWVGHAYRFAAVWLTSTLADVRQANMLLERSFEYHPDEWRNYFYLGFNHFYHLNDSKAAADALLIASQKPGSPRYLPRLVARLRSDSSNLAAAGIFLEELVKNAPDDASRAEYQAALDEIELEWWARKLDRAREQFKKLEGRDIEAVLDLVVGTHGVLPELPPAEPSSLPAPLRRGSRWVIDEETGQIESTYLGRRYVVHLDRGEREAAMASAAQERRLAKSERPGSDARGSSDAE